MIAWSALNDLRKFKIEVTWERESLEAQAWPPRFPEELAGEVVAKGNWGTVGVKEPAPPPPPPPPPPPEAGVGGGIGDGVGGVTGEVSVTLDTIMATEVEVAVFPAWSSAVATRVWAPFETPVVFHVPEYGDVVRTTPRLNPSSLNWTLDIPLWVWPGMMGSEVAAERETDEPDTVALFVGKVMETVGGVRSGVREMGEVVNVWSPDWAKLLEESRDMTL